MIGLGLVILSYAAGIPTGWFPFHITFILGFWLASDALAWRVTGRSLWRDQKWAAGQMVLFAGLLGVILDYHLIEVHGVLHYEAVQTVPMALVLYFGWGLCLPGIVESYRVVAWWLGHRDPHARPEPVNAQEWPPTFRRLLDNLAWIGLVWIAAPLLVRMYTSSRAGEWLIASFVGFWFVAEGLLFQRGQTGFLAAALCGQWQPWATATLASAVLTLTWEGLNGIMGSWMYGNLFWLTPKIINVPLVVFFGYGYWYLLFMTVYWLGWAKRGTMEKINAQNYVSSHPHDAD